MICRRRGSAMALKTSVVVAARGMCTLYSHMGICQASTPPSGNPALAQPLDYGLPAVAIRSPHRHAPRMNRLVPLRPGPRGQNVGSPWAAAVAWQRQGRPATFSAREGHVHALDLPARELLLHEQVKTDQRERKLNGTCLFIRMLRGKRIDHVLMNERRIPMGECVVAQLVVGILGSHNAPSVFVR